MIFLPPRNPAAASSPFRRPVPSTILLALATVLGAAVLGELPADAVPTNPTIVSQFTVPGTEPRGLTWDGTNLWLADKSRRVHQLDTNGTSLGSFMIGFNPTGLAWDGTCLWIGDDANRRQVKLDRQGNVLGTLNAWYWPRSGIAWDGTGFWVGDYNFAELHRHSPQGDELRSWRISGGGGIEHPTGLAFDGRTLWVGDPNEGFQNNVSRYRLDGQFLATFDTKAIGINPVTWPELKALAWDGKFLWYAADDTLQVYRLDISTLPGESTSEPSNPPVVGRIAVPAGSPRGLAWDGQSLWVVDVLRNVFELDRSGTVRSRFRILFEPSGMTWDGASLWIGDDTNERQVRIDRQGNILGTLDVHYWSRSGIAWDGTGFWIGDYNLGRVYKHDPQGTLLLSWDTRPGFTATGIEHPTGLAFDGAHLWVGDPNEGFANNIARFLPSGQFLDTFDTKRWNLPPVAWPEFKVMTWDGEDLWYSADDLFSIYRLDVNGLTGHTNTLPALSIGDITVAEGHTGAVSAIFPLRLSRASPQAITVRFATAGGSAVAGLDFVSTNGSLTFPAGQTNLSLAVLVLGDSMGETNEQFVVNLSTAANAQIADGQGVGVILDDDARFLPGAWSLRTESCSPNNSVVDPDEVVGIRLPIRNVGAAAAANLVVTLLSGGGVRSPSPSQRYGNVAGDGGEASGDFTFQAAGECGASITTVFHLQWEASPPVLVTNTLSLGGRQPILNEDFDGVAAPNLPPGWSVALSGAGPAWIVSTNSRDTFPHALFAPDPPGVSDNRLTTPLISIATTNALLSFQHRYNTEAGYDGGVLEIAIAEGDFTDILAAGGAFLTNGYARTMSGSGPIAGRMAWSGNSGAFRTTAVRLPASAAGQFIRLQWRMTTDVSVGSEGWFVDTVRLEDGIVCCRGLAIPSPRVLSVARRDPLGQLTSAGSVEFVVRFDTNVNNVQFEDFTVTRVSGNLSGGGVTSLGSSSAQRDRYYVGVTTGAGDGELRLDVLVPGASIADDTGKPLQASFTNGETYQIDKSRPTIVDILDVVPEMRTNAVSSVEVVLSEAIDLSTFTWADLVLSRNGVNLELTNRVGIESLGSTRYRISGLEALTAPAGRYVMTIDAAGIRDFAVNPGMDSASVTWINTVESPGGAPPPLEFGGVDRDEGNLGDQFVTIQVALPYPSLSPVTVEYATADYTARADDQDYWPTNGILVFGPGETNKSVGVRIRGDTRIEPMEAFGVQFETVGANRRSDGTAVVQILNDDAGRPAYWGPHVPCGGYDFLYRDARVLAVDAGYYHQVALAPNGTVLMYGVDGPTQTPAPAGLGNVIAIAAGEEHSLALRRDGTVVAWGWNLYGQSAVPDNLSNVVSIAAGGTHSLALRADGRVVGWGSLSPPPNLSNIVAIAGGGGHGLALRANGTVLGWGDNYAGQSTSPPALSNVVAIAAGDSHSLALRSDGTVVAWGHNFYGQVNVPTALSNVTAIAAGRGHNLALTRLGAVVSWGSSEIYCQGCTPHFLARSYAVAAGPLSSEVLLAEEATPRVLGIFRAAPSEMITTSPTVSFGVQFNKSVNGVSLTGDLVPIDLWNTLQGERIVSLGSSGGQGIYSVQVNTGTNDGSLRLDLPVPGATIADDSGRVVADSFTNGPVYVIDRERPKVRTIRRQSSAHEMTTPTWAVFRVEFTEHMNGILPTDFTTSAASGSLAGHRVVSVETVSGAVVDVTTWTGTGDGTLRLDVLSNVAQMIDDAGNRLPENFTVGETFRINTVPQSESLISADSVWRYLDNGSNPGTHWNDPHFDDSRWSAGCAPLGYGDADECTVVEFGPQPDNKYITTYFRHSFTVQNTGRYSSLRLRAIRDDGIVVYLNGREVLRDNLPGGPIGYRTLALEWLAGEEERRAVEACVSPGLLVEGTNVISAEVHQGYPESSDISFDLELTTEPPPTVSLASLRVAGELWMTWPATGRCYELETTDSFSPTAPWRPVGITPILDGDTMRVTVPILAGQRFYRLHAP